MIRWHRTTVAAANPPATTPAACRAAPSATYSPGVGTEPAAEDGRRDPADRCPACATADRQVWPEPDVRSVRVRGFPPERTTGTAVSGGHHGGTATRRRIRKTGLAAGRTAAPQPQAQW